MANSSDARAGGSGLLRYCSVSTAATSGSETSKRQHEEAAATDHDHQPDVVDAEPPKKKAKPSAKPGGVKLSTVLSWKRQGADTNGEAVDLSWIKYEASIGIVTKIWCDACNRKPDLVKKMSQRQGKIADIEAFISGTKNLQKTNMVRHAKTLPHKMAVEAVDADEMRPEDRPIEKAIIRITKETFDRMQKLFEISYLVAKEEMPFTKFPKLMELEKKHGVPLGSAYQNNNACKTFIKHCAVGIREEVEVHLRSPDTVGLYKYHSIFSDGTTDKSTSEREVIYIKILQDGEPKMKYLGLIDVEEADATGLKSSLYALYQQYLGITRETQQPRAVDPAVDQEDDADLEENEDTTPTISGTEAGLIGVGADGASVNFGAKHGMIAQIREDVPWLVGVHCIAHRLELAVKDALKESFLTNEIDPILKGIYAFYSRSPKRLRRLRYHAKKHKQSTVAFQRVDGTRWVAHHKNALEAFLRNFYTLIKHLQEVCSPGSKEVKDTVKQQMKGWTKKMLSSKFLLASNFYLDVLSELTVISETFQRTDISMPDTMDTLNVAFATLKRLEEPDYSGVHLELVMKKLQVNEEGLGVFNGLVLTDLQSANESLASMRASTMAQVQECTQKRFEDFSNNPLFSEAAVFDHTSWPVNDESDESDYGETKVGFLLEHFYEVLVSQGCKTKDVRREWSEIKLYVAKHQWLQQLDYKAFWKHMFNKRQKRYPNLLHLVAIIQVYPISNAELERAFSAMKRVVADWRTSLSTSTIDDLLLIKQEGPPQEEFSCKKAIKSWLFNNKRRPDKRSKRRKPAATAGPNKEQEQEELEKLEEEDVEEEEGNEKKTEDREEDSDIEVEEVDIIDVLEDGETSENEIVTLTS